MKKKQMHQRDLQYRLAADWKHLKPYFIERGIYLRNKVDVNRKFGRNSNYFDCIDTPNKAYILGYIYADGNVHSGRPTFTINLQDRDKYILDKMKEEMGYEGELRLARLHDKNPNYRNQYVLSIQDIHMTEQLKKEGVVPRKSLILTFPTFISEELMPHFIRGYFDGDGTIHNDEKKRQSAVRIAGTYEFLSGVKKELNKRKIACNLTYPKTKYQSNTYILNIGGNRSIRLFGEWIYKDADMMLIRKYDRFEYMYNNYPYRTTSREFNELAS